MDLKKAWPYYGGHLANVAAENFSLPGKVQTFKAMSQAMKGLYGQVIAHAPVPKLNEHVTVEQVEETEGKK